MTLHKTPSDRNWGRQAERQLEKGAVDEAVGVFNAALARIGLPHGSVVHVDAQPIEDRIAVLV